MEVDGYRHNFEGFCESFTYLMCIIKRRMTTFKGSHMKVFGKSPFSSHSLLSIQPSKNHENTSRGYTLNGFIEFFP